MTHRNKLIGIAILEGMYKKMPLLKLIGFVPVLILKTGFSCAYRTINYFIHNLKQRNKISNKCHHLSVISIDKKKQRKGFGKAMMKKIHKMIDKSKRSKGITLETSNKNVLGFYKKNSYKVYKKWNLGEMPVFHLIRKRLKKV
jgi:ribosomal protein S18 acetylase RimI-like enzyme